MKIVFVNPPLSPEERYGALAEAANTMPSLGLLSLAAAAREAGAETAIIEASSLGLGLEETTARVRELSPTHVGMTATTASIHRAADLAAMLKEQDRAIDTIVGGPHATALPEKVMDMFPQFDIAVIGEGEETIAELVEARKNGGGPSSVAGLALRENGAVRVTGKRELVKDLDRLAFPAWDLLEGFPERYRPPGFRFRRLPAASLVTSRGCPSKCIFCDRSVFGSAHRRFGADYVLEMMGTLHREYRVREILFEDDTFLLDRPRVRAICEKLVREGPELSWSCLGRVSAADPELLALMKRAGCWQIGYGIESGNQEILDMIGKGTRLERIEEALAATRKAGMRTKGFFMIGHPKETEETIRETIAFARKAVLDDFSITRFTPFPGSEIYERTGEYGEFDDDWKKMNLMNTVFVPHGLTAEAIDRYAATAFRRFYLRPGIILRYLGRMLRNPGSAPGILKGFLAFLRMAAHR